MSGVSYSSDVRDTEIVIRSMCSHVMTSQGKLAQPSLRFLTLIFNLDPGVKDTSTLELFGRRCLRRSNHSSFVRYLRHEQPFGLQAFRVFPELANLRFVLPGLTQSLCDKLGAGVAAPIIAAQ